MPTTRKTLRALRAALKKAHDEAKAHTERVTELERPYMLGRAHGIAVAQRIVEAMCQ